MLIRFSFKNYKSVGLEPLTLEMVSSAKVRTHKDHVCPSSKKAKVLRNAVIYGGNAAGKSTIVKAFLLLKAAVLGGGLPPESSQDYCRCGQGFEKDESTFDIQFQIGSNVFDYGFSCILSRMEVKSEWLYCLDSSAKSVFERNGSKTVTFGKWLQEKCGGSDQSRLNIYKEDFLNEERLSIGAGLFLTYVSRGRGVRNDSALSIFSEVLSWFSSSLDVIRPGQPTSTTEFYSADGGLDAVAEVLASFDTGINKLKKTPIPLADLEKYVDEGALFAIRDILRNSIPRSDDAHAVLTLRNENIFLGIERTGIQEPRATILQANHEGSLLDFDFRDESDGTRRLFDFMDLLFTESERKVFVVDEFNRSFHPMLTQHFVELFNEVHANDDCQLVFTTHENDIMSYKYFRRDEIWFVERNLEGYSHIYPLDEFASEGARSDARINKKYLEGRYGGVPVIAISKARAALGIEAQ